MTVQSFQITNACTRDVVRVLLIRYLPPTKYLLQMYLLGPGLWSFLLITLSHNPLSMGSFGSLQKQIPFSLASFVTLFMQNGAQYERTIAEMLYGLNVTLCQCFRVLLPCGSKCHVILVTWTQDLYRQLVNDSSVYDLMCVSVQGVSLNARDRMVESTSQKELEKKLKCLKWTNCSYYTRRPE